MGFPAGINRPVATLRRTFECAECHKNFARTVSPRGGRPPLYCGTVCERRAYNRRRRERYPVKRTAICADCGDVMQLIRGPGRVPTSCGKCC